MERSTVTKDISQESTLLYSRGKKVKVIGTIYLLAGAFLVFGIGWNVIKTFMETFKVASFLSFGLYPLLAGIFLMPLGFSQLLYAEPEEAEKRKFPDWLPLIHILPYWLIVTAMNVGFFGVVGAFAYQELFADSVDTSSRPDMPIVMTIFVFVFIAFFAVMFFSLWKPVMQRFLAAVYGLLRPAQIGLFNKARYRFGDTIRFSMKNIRGKRQRVFLNLVHAGHKEHRNGPRATPYTKYIDVTASNLHDGVELQIPEQDNWALSRITSDHYWEVLVETHDSTNWASFLLKIN